VQCCRCRCINKGVYNNNGDNNGYNDGGNNGDDT